MPVTVQMVDDLAMVEIDNPPVNATSTVVRAGLMHAVDQVIDLGARVAILTGHGANFIAGGDVSEFDREPEEPHLPDVVDAIEVSPVPWIAALYGNCLGGGLEIALGCRSRLAHPNARLGLPEVLIGLIPGAGAPQRLPRLIELDEAIELMTSGRPISAEKALAIGLVDDLIAADGHDAFLAACRDCVRDRPLSEVSPLSERQLRGSLTQSSLTEKRETLKQKSRGWHAPVVALNALHQAGELPFRDALARSRQTHLAMRGSDQSKALRHAFFAERRAAKPAVIKGFEARPIRHVGIVGGGLMGTGIATACLMAGFEVTLSEQHHDVLDEGLDRIAGMIEGARKRGKLTDRQAKDSLANLSGTTGVDALAPVDLAIEAVFEDEVTKVGVFEALAATTGEDTILATNTSYLNPDRFTQGIANPGRIVGLHFFSPAHIMRLVEIVRCHETSPETLATGFAFAKRLGKFGVMSGICDGFVGNRILAAYRRASDYLLQDGALPHEIDAAMRAFGFPMGPYEMQDMAGLQIAWANRKRQAFSRPESERYVTIADTLCEDGRFGQKSGAGWYRYEEGSRVPRQDAAVEALILDSSDDAGIARRSFAETEIQDRLLAVMVNEGAKIIEEGIVERPLDVDVVELHGYGFPRWRGGPMCYADQVGPDNIARTIEDLVESDPGSWTASDLLLRIARSESKFNDLNQNRELADA